MDVEMMRMRKTEDEEDIVGRAFNLKFEYIRIYQKRIVLSTGWRGAGNGVRKSVVVGWERGWVLICRAALVRLKDPWIAVWNAVWTENRLLPGARFPQFVEGKGTERSLVSGSVVVVVVTTNKRT